MDLTEYGNFSSQTPQEKVGIRSNLTWISLILTGMMVPLGFAPFHFPGAAILGIALFYYHIRTSRPQKAFIQGFVWGLGLFGVGISWVSVSIHTFGHLPNFYAYLITGLFVCYLALFPALCAFAFRVLCPTSEYKRALLFSGLWCISEYLRANLMTGFPWLLLGFGQIDTPLKYLLPIIGVYGIGFLIALAACCLTHIFKTPERNTLVRMAWLVGFVLILITPASLKNINWSQWDKSPLSVGVVQANLSMRDKWNEQLFWKIIKHYHRAIQPLLAKKDIIVLPEAAIPLPSGYVQDFLTELHQQAQKNKSAILFGIPEEIYPEKTHFYNTLSTIGLSEGRYRKQHLVPFGEYLPRFLEPILRPLNLVMSDMQAGDAQQPLASAQHHPFATLICYELAYPCILRQQLPQAQWIVSLSDDGWFGHSLASYQQLQMAQALSILTSRYQIVANNDGLSSIITPRGRLQKTLPAFSSGILEGNIYPAHGSTPWVIWGDAPILGLCGLIVIFALWGRVRLSR